MEFKIPIFSAEFLSEFPSATSTRAVFKCSTNYYNTFLSPDQKITICNEILVNGVERNAVSTYLGLIKRRLNKMIERKK